MFSTQPRNLREGIKRNITYSEKRSNRAVNQRQQRRESRYHQFSSNREIDEDLFSNLTGSQNKTEDAKKKQLKLWRQAKEKQRMAEREKTKQKPPFKCGIVHHKFTAEFPKDIRRVTRKKSTVVTKVASFAPKEHKFKPPINLVPILIQENAANPEKIEPERTTVTTKNANSSSSKNERKRASKGLEKEAFPIKRFTRSSIRESEFPMPSKKKALSPVKEKPPEIEEEDDEFNLEYFYPVRFSPYVSINRGGNSKDSPVRSNRKNSPVHVKRGSSRKNSPMPAKDAVKDSGGLRKTIAVKLFERKLDDPEVIKMEEEKLLSSGNVLATPIVDEKTEIVQRFRGLHSDEMKRLGSFCLEWDSMLISEEIPLEIKDSIRSTVGQARLLMREKLAQFRGLVDKYESFDGVQKKTGEEKIIPSDLQGFWDLVSIQVEDIHKKFQELTAIKENGWVEKSKTPVVVEKRKLRIKGTNKINTNKEEGDKKKSALQTFLRERRKKKSPKDELENIPTVLITTPSAVPRRASKRRSSSWSHSQGADVVDEKNKKVENMTGVPQILITTPGGKKSILKRRSSRRSRLVDISASEDFNISVAATPKRVMFKDTANDGRSVEKKVRLTPHVNKIKDRVVCLDFSGDESVFSPAETKPKNANLSDGAATLNTTPLPSKDLIMWSPAASGNSGGRRRSSRLQST